MKYLDGEELTIEEIKSCIRKSTIANHDGSRHAAARSYRNKGVQKLLDAVVDYMPAPTDVPDIKGVNPDTEEEETRPSERRRAFCRSRFQDRDRPLCRQAVLLPCVLRYCGCRHQRLQLGEEKQ